MSTDPTDSEIRQGLPDKLGKYQILGLLGRGAMGVVYRGFDPKIERMVAIKTMRRLPTDDSDPAIREAEERFHREAKAAGRLSHPGIVAVYDFGEDGDTAFIVMELVVGRMLKDELASRGGLPLPDVVRIMVNILAALDYSHRMDVVHRDIKPGNIILTESGEAKIMDFGIAKLECSTMTQVGSILGTPSYMSPEQFLGATVDQRSDIFSAGSLLYEMLSGRKPFSGSFATVMQQVVNGDPPPLSSIKPDLPVAFDKVVARALAKRPEDRYQSAGEFAQDVMAAADGDEEASTTPVADVTMILTRPLSKPAPDARAPASVPWRPIAGGLAGLGLVGALAWWLLSSPVHLLGDRTIEQPPDSSAATPRTDISLLTDRGATPSYRVGEHMEFTATVTRDAFVSCFYQPASGEVFRVFPNSAAANPFLHSGDSVTVPGTARFKFRFDQANSKEKIMCLASPTDWTAALPDIAGGQALRPLPFADMEAIIRLVQQQTAGQISVSAIDIAVRS